MFKMSKNAMLFNGAALIIVAASAVMVVRSALFHDDAPPCLDRYRRGTVLNLEANGTPLGIEDLQSRAGGTDWGLLAGGRVVKLKSGPAKAAMEFNKEANEMAKVAQAGDAAAVGAQLGKVGGTCKGCHDDFKAKR